jgi:hypothetical protein
MVNPELVGTVITGGCHVVGLCASVLPAAVQVTPVALLQTQPHIGTEVPSGNVVFCRAAVSVTDWANEVPAARRRIATASRVVFSVGFILWDRI